MARKGNDAEVLERGNIYFLYRPKVQKEQARGAEEVERFYVVLSPEGKRKKYREIIIGQKALPKIKNGERNWGFVKMVTGSTRALERELGEVRYETKTRGERDLSPARPAGEGIYAIVRHGSHTHLAYSLELPEKPSEVQREFRIEEEASYIISVKNPEKPSPWRAGLGEDQKVEYPSKLRAVFGDKRFADADPPEFLDYEGTEIVLIGAREDPADELGVRLPAEKETEKSADIFT